MQAVGFHIKGFPSPWFNNQRLSEGVFHKKNLKIASVNCKTTFPVPEKTTLMNERGGNNTEMEKESFLIWRASVDTLFWVSDWICRLFSRFNKLVNCHKILGVDYCCCFLHCCTEMKHLSFIPFLLSLSAFSFVCLPLLLFWPSDKWHDREVFNTIHFGCANIWCSCSSFTSGTVRFEVQLR